MPSAEERGSFPEQRLVIEPISNSAVSELTRKCNIVSIIMNFGTRKAATSSADAQDEEKNGCCHRRFHCGSAVE